MKIQWMITPIFCQYSSHFSPDFPYQNWAMAAAKTLCPEPDAQRRAPGPSGAVGLDGPNLPQKTGVLEG